MAKSKKFKKRLFMVQRELNVSAATLEEYLEDEGYASALKGKGLNAKITDEEAYLDLLEAFADDQETRQRVQEMRAAREAEVQAEASGDGMPAEPAAEAAEEEEEAAAEASEEEPEVVEEAEPVAEAVDEEDEEEAAVAEVEEEEEAVAEAEDVDEEEEVVAEAETDGQAEPVAEAADEEDEEEAAVAEVEEEEEAVAEADEEDEEEEDEEGTLKANRYRLSGPNVVGKVNLEEIKEKARERRKKRRRKRKERKEARKKKKQKKQKKKQKKQKKKLDEEDIEAQMQKTLNELEQGVSRIRQRRRRQRRERHEEEREREAERRREEEKILNITEFISTGELANLMEEDVTDVIRVLMDAGRMVSINQRLDAEAISYVADDFGYEVEFIDEFEAEEILLEEDAPEDLEPRAPVVTVMGHVDHGKTSLLDYVRAANVVAGEAGGITQHIGAYRVNLPDNERDITFLDTPGHEAFTAMRARGAKATDLVILVVAADDGVMPQTVEAINHAQAAEVPIVVAINKMDLPEANPQRVMQELTEHNILVEPYGGTVQCAEISAETGEGINDLLEKVLLESDLLELKANPNRFANGIIVESRLEKGRGNVATVLVQNGTLEVGDNFVGGIYSGRVRAMFDERDQRIEKAGPSQPALVLGFNGSPEVGDQFVAMEDESEARDIAQRRQQIHREQQLRQKKHITLEEIGRRLAIGEFHELNLIIKADVGGSVEAVSDALMKLKTEEVAVNVIHTGVGAITENDVMLASASDAVILGFQVRPRPGARQLAEQEEIDVRTYSVIYEAVEDVRLALEGLLSPERSEETTGMAEVRETFKVPGVGTVAGGYVTEGQIKRNDKVRVVREGVVVYDGTISSLKRFKEDVREVQTGYEFGIGIENFDDIKVGDEVEAYEVVETRRTLEV